MHFPLPARTAKVRAFPILMEFRLGRYAANQ